MVTGTMIHVHLGRSMARIIVLAIVEAILILIGQPAVGDESGSEPHGTSIQAKQLLGSWTHSDGTTITFESHGKITRQNVEPEPESEKLTLLEDSNHGTWQVNKNTITITAEQPEKPKKDDNYSYSIEQHRYDAARLVLEQGTQKTVFTRELPYIPIMFTWYFIGGLLLFFLIQASLRKKAVLVAVWICILLLTTGQLDWPTFVPFLVMPLGLGSSRVDLQACKLEYSIVSPK